jgi:dCTP deaminase
MAFGFLTDKEIKKLGPNFLGNYFDVKRVESASYRLSLGEEAYISGEDYPSHLSETNPYVSLPRGQFALLMTKEYIKLPKEYLGLISIRLGKKEQGLINISGFHVDPGFEGKLMFSVFNAGPSDVVLKYDDDMFVIFFYKLEYEVEDSYNKYGTRQKQAHLPTGLVTSLKGTSASLADVDKRVRDLEITIKVQWALLIVLFGALIALFLRGVFGG